MQDDDNPYELMRHNIQVHRLIYRLAANALLDDVLIRCDNLAMRIWCMVLEKGPSVAEHVALLEAIADGDADRAATLVLEHVTGFEEAIRSVL